MIKVGNLVLEITRKCNMVCPHCLRGPAENLDMDNEIIDKVLEQVEIDMVTFTGGEPSLNVSAIRYFTDSVINQEKELYSFWLATNAKVYSPDMVSALIDLNAYVSDFSGDENYSGLSVSLDAYHSSVENMNIRKYKSLSFFEPSKDFSERDDRVLINDGLAEANGIGQKTILGSVQIDIEDDDIIVDTLYINANGDVVCDCDFSYERQKRISLGNIYEQSLKDILLAQV